MSRSQYYREYLKSEEWRTLRKEKLLESDEKCECCGASPLIHRGVRLEVHHMDYDNLGDEDLEDLATLCSECHKDADRERKADAYQRRVDGWVHAARERGDWRGTSDIEREFEVFVDDDDDWNW